MYNKIKNIPHKLTRKEMENMVDDLMTENFAKTKGMMFVIHMHTTLLFQGSNRTSSVITLGKGKCIGQRVRQIMLENRRNVTIEGKSINGALVN